MKYKKGDILKGVENCYYEVIDDVNGLKIRRIGSNRPFICSAEILDECTKLVKAYHTKLYKLLNG